LDIVLSTMRVSTHFVGTQKWTYGVSVK